MLATTIMTISSPRFRHMTGQTPPNIATPPRSPSCRLSGLTHLSETGMVPEKYRPRPLSGNYRGTLECHIENDFLLIWVDESEQIIKLVRLGSNSELFG